MNGTVTYLPLEDAERLDARNKAKGLPILSAAALGAMTFPPIKYIVPGVLPEGATILAGRPKLGKSWLALDIALAVARGDYCLGDRKCVQGDVLYLALEDNRRRLQSRIAKVSPHGSDTPWPEALELATEWKRCDEGGVGMLRDWAAARESPRLIIIDVLAQFRTGRGSQESLYEADYRAVKEVQELASELDLGVLIIHHVRKGSGDFDPFERVSGSMGLTGAADTTIVLDRDGNGCSLYGRGRDIQEYEQALSFSKENCRWTIQGDASEVRRTDERSAILDALLEAQDLMTPKDICIATGMSRNNCDQLLYKMAHSGEVLKAGRGSYAHPSRPELIDA
jgi:RecA-family ATPase